MVEVIYSDYAGLGKTTYIRHKVNATSSQRVVLFLTGELNNEVLNKRMMVLEESLKKVQSCCLHIKLDTL